MSRRARSAASRIRAREARHLGELRLGDRVLAHRLLGLAALGDVEDRPVEPPAAVARLLGEPALEHPADRAVAAHEPVLERERPAGPHRLHDAVGDVVVVVGVLDARERADRVADEVGGRVAGHRLDLVAQPLHRPVAVAGAAVDRARDAVDQRAQHRVVGPQAGGAQARRDAQDQHVGVERDAHDVVRPCVERIAQLVGRVEVDARDDVDARQLGPRPHGADQVRAVLRVDEHDLRRALLDDADGRAGIAGAQDAEAGREQHLPCRVADHVEADQQHRVALADEPVERARPRRSRGGGTPETAFGHDRSTVHPQP